MRLVLKIKSELNNSDSALRKDKSNLVTYSVYGRIVKLLKNK